MKAGVAASLPNHISAYRGLSATGTDEAHVAARNRLIYGT